MASLQEIFENDNFYRLTDDDKYTVIERSEPRFGQLSDADKARAYDKIYSKYKAEPKAAAKIDDGLMPAHAQAEPQESPGEKPKGFVERIGDVVERIPQEARESISNTMRPIVVGLSGAAGVAGGLAAGPGAVFAAPAGGAIAATGGAKGQDWVDQNILRTQDKRGLKDEVIDTAKQLGINALAYGSSGYASAAAPLTNSALTVGRNALAGGLGNAAGEEIEKIDSIRKGEREQVGVGEDLKNAAANVAVGSAMDLAGDIAGPAAKKIIKTGKTVLKTVSSPKKAFTASAEKRAADVLLAHTSKGKDYDAEFDRSKKLGKEIDGYKPTLDQQRADPELGQLKRVLIRKNQAGPKLVQENAAGNQEAIQNYHQKNFDGDNDIEDVISSAVNTKDSVRANDAASLREVGDRLESHNAVAPFETGANITAKVESGKPAVRREMNRLKAEIPDVKIGLNNTDKEIQRVLGSKMSSDYEISEANKIVAKIMKKAPDWEDQPHLGVSSHDAIGIRRTISERVDALKESGHDKSAYELDKIKRALDKDLETPWPENEKKNGTFDPSKNIDFVVKSYTEKIKTLRDSGNEKAALTLEASKDALESKQAAAIDAMTAEKRAGEVTAHAAIKKFNAYAEKQWFGRFKSGAVGKAMAKGNQRSGLRIPEERKPDMFMSATGADDLINGIGKDDARVVMRGHAAYLLHKNAVGASGKVSNNSLRRFMQTNGPALERYGIRAEFDGLQKAQARADSAARAASDYEQSALARVIGVDPEKAVEAVFTGRKKGESARELLDQIKGDSAAENGIKKAVADYLISRSATTARDIKQNPKVSYATFDKQMKEYAHVVREIYKNAPQQKKALENMQQAYRNMTRNVASPIGGGSDTNELTIEQLMKEFATTKMMVSLPKWGQMAFGAFDVLKNIRGQRQEEILLKAIFDPDYAQTLYGYASGKTTKKQFKHKFNALVADTLRSQSLTASAKGTVAAVTNTDDLLVENDDK